MNAVLHCHVLEQCLLLFAYPYYGTGTDDWNLMQDAARPHTGIITKQLLNDIGASVFNMAWKESWFKSNGKRLVNNEKFCLFKQYNITYKTKPQRNGIWGLGMNNATKTWHTDWINATAMFAYDLE